jgi:hypothetical protein
MSGEIVIPPGSTEHQIVALLVEHSYCSSAELARLLYGNPLDPTVTDAQRKEVERALDVLRRCELIVASPRAGESWAPM